MSALADSLAADPYRSYAYAYPHKTAYRHLDPPIPLGDLWAGERRESLFLYLHVPFCEMRCGFCNLFTTVHPGGDLESAYLDALEREAQQASAGLGSARFARMAIGGGTPTYLQPAALARLFDLAGRLFGVDCATVPTSVETSPGTADRPRLRLLRERGVERISIGVQSFVGAEVAAVGRAQSAAAVETALECIRATGFPTLNLDLIYGLPGQSVQSWLGSLEAALRLAPEELYLYPLYVRPLTGLGRRGRAWDDLRLACYREGRARLRAAGYRQVSMRMFRAGRAAGPADSGYCCQDDGMVGLGCGARSYTRALHYSNEYAVGARSVRAILAEYVARRPDAAGLAAYGFRLDDDEQRRRYVIKSLLQVSGLSLAAYRSRFGREATADLPAVGQLVEAGLAVREGEVVALTERGLELSDAIGPWLYSPAVDALTAAYEPR